MLEEIVEGGYDFNSFREEKDTDIHKLELTESIINSDDGINISYNTGDLSINLIDNGELIVHIWKLDGTLIKFNNYAQRKTGYTEDEVLGNKWINTIVPEDDLPGLYRTFDAMKKGKIPPISECKIYCKNHSALNILWSNYIVHNKKGEPHLAISVGMDITELKRTSKKLMISYEELQKIYNELEETQKQLRKQLQGQYKIAYYDELTGLPNRAMLWKQLSSELAVAKQNNGKTALLSMDIDNFKNINDILGHNNGDELLRIIADRINKLANSDIDIARYGGDEFLALIKSVDNKDKVIEFCRRVIGIFEQPININGMELYVTISIGGAIYPEDGEDEYTLLKNADIAMYNSKEQHGNWFELFNNDMNLRIIEKLELENGLREALKNHEFCIHYQPQIDIDSSDVVGLEALIRWKHPVKGLIPPAKFIPIAEETGFIIQIGEWVLKKACEQFIEWQKKGIEPRRIAINISAKQFEQNNFVLIVKSIIEETGINPRYIELEITESIAMKNLDYTIKVINELKKLNIKVSLDDFGTGYSSLNYLMRLPINTLKIDKSFLNNVKLDSNEEIIAKTIITLAKKMKLDVVAEGVETFEQLRFLKEQSCDIAQGYLFSRPVSENEVMDILMRKKIFL